MQKLFFIRQTIDAYRLAYLFAVSALTITSIPVLFEALQHLIEWKFGMFDSSDGIQAGTEESMRLISGALKVSSLLFVLVVAARYYLHDCNIRQALSFSSRARGAAIWSITLMVVLLILVFYAGPLLVKWIIELGAEVPEKLQAMVPLLVLLALSWPIQGRMLQLFATLLDDADTQLNIQDFVKIWSRQMMPVLLLAIGPAMFMHIKLNVAAIDRPVGLQIGLLVVDSLLVGIMGVLLGTATWVSYRDAKIKALSE